MVLESSSRGGSLSLRGQLLLGLGLLLLVALLALAFALLVWLPAGWSDLALAAAVLGLAVVLVGVLLLFSDFLLRRLLIEPLRGMVRDAGRIAEGDHGHRLEGDGPAELRQLAASVNEMAERLIHQTEELADNVRSLDDVNRALTEARDELVRAEKLASVGRLAAGLAHEIGNPLNAITTYVEIGRRRTDPVPEWLRGISDEAARIDRIVDGLLDYARPRDGPAVAVRPNEVVRDTVELLERQGRLRGVEVRLELGEGISRVQANPFHLQQVLVNLLLNACDAIEDSGDGGEVVVRSRGERAGGRPGERPRPRRRDDPDEVDYSHIRRYHARPSEIRRPGFPEGTPLVVLEVEDDGPGLPAGDAERVFDPFFTTKDPGKGTGLGLSVSARLVEEMGGIVEATSLEEAGSLFRIRLPAASEEGGGDRASTPGREGDEGRKDTTVTAGEMLEAAERDG